MKSFLWNDRGYALVLTLLFMPVFVGICLIVIDLARANNANSVLFAAADAVALAAAGELDGGIDAIDRALDAAAEVSNTVSFLGLGEGEYSVTLDYDGSDAPFIIRFLTQIPDDDAVPIDWNYLIKGRSAEEQASAKYVWVHAESINLNPMFPLPVTGSDQDVPIHARAVAKRQVGVCEITPLFICNPFEEEPSPGKFTGSDFQAEFAKGRMNSRLVSLHDVQGAADPGPGNYGFLDMGSGNNDLSAFMASEDISASA